MKLNLDGTEKEYRVLSRNGSVCKVMGMFDDLAGAWDSSMTTTTMGSMTVQKYENSTLDTYLNNTWYNTLSDTAKAAIVPESIVCDAWYENDSGDPDYTGTYGSSTTEYSYTISKYTGGTLNIGSRNVFVLGIQDIIDYLSDESMRVDTSGILRNKNIWKMFWNDEEAHHQDDDIDIWLTTASLTSSSMAFTVVSMAGNLMSINQTQNSNIIRPAFNLDFSKISFTIT